MNADTTYRKFVQYYDVYVEGFDKDLQFYKSLCQPQEKILEVGCGTGRVLTSFLKDGFHITGIDISQEMLDVAEKKLTRFSQQGRVRLRLHNFTKQPLTEKYDKVLVTFYTFNYILKHPETFLGNIYASMAEDSMLLMDLFSPKTLANRGLDDVWTTHEFRYHDNVIHMKDKRIFSNDIEERIQIYVENGEETRITSIRKYYAPMTIKRLLEIVGFRQIMFSESYDVNNFEENMRTENLTKNFLVNAVKGEPMSL